MDGATRAASAKQTAAAFDVWLTCRLAAVSEAAQVDKFCFEPAFQCRHITHSSTAVQVARNF
jgi:hypothetical protein